METTWTEIKAVTSVQDYYYFDKRGEAFASAGLPDLDTPALHGIDRQVTLTLKVATARMQGDGAIQGQLQASVSTQKIG